MDVGRIEAVLTARFDKDPFDKYERAINGAQSEARRPVTAELRADYNGKDFQRFDKETGQARAQARRPIRQEIKTDYDETGMRRYRDAQGRLRDERGRYIAQDSAMDRSNRRTGAGFTALASNAKFLAGGAAIGGLAIAFRGMYQEQAEAQAASAQLRSVLTSMGTAAGVTEGHMNKLAQAIGKKAAIDDEAVVSSGALMLTFGKVRNEAGKNNDIFDRSIQASVDLSRAFGKDLQGSTIMLGKALNDPIKGLTAMSRVGVSFTEGQKEQVKAMVASGDTLGAQKLILGELERQVGGSAEAYGKTLPGAVDRAGLAFKDFLEIAGEKVAPAVSAAADVIEGLFDGSLFKGKGGGMFQPIINGAKQIAAAVRPAFTEVARAFNEMFGGKNKGETMRNLREIIKGIGDAMGLLAGIVKRAAAGMVQAWRGLFQIIRGIGRVIGGILSGDWGKAFDGVKDIVAGAFRVIMGLFRSATAPLREVLARLLAPVGRFFSNAWRDARNAVTSGVRAVISAIRSAIGAVGSAARSVGNAILNPLRSVWNSVRSAVSAGMRLVTSLVRAQLGAATGAARAVGNGIRNAFNVVGDVAGRVRGFISRAIDTVRGLAGSAASAASSVGSNIVSGMAGAIRSGASTILNAILSLIPGKLKGAARSVLGFAMGGKVGPGSGGPRMFMAGEGRKDEWVISQEGPKAANVAWAVEALETLTGRRVAMFRNGGKPTKAKLRKALGRIPDNWKSGLQSRMDSVEQKETEYDQAERRYAIGNDNFLTNNADGSVTVNRDVVSGRITELDDLIAKKNAITAQVRKLIEWIDDTSKKLKTAIDLLRALARKANKKTRKKYGKKADAFAEARSAMLEVRPDLDNDLVDLGIDVEELNFERGEVAAYYGQGKGPDPDTGGGDGGGGDTPGTVAPSPEEIARAAAAQVAAFTANRASLFSDFGQNFIGVGGTLTPLTEASGFRYFGGGQVGGGILGASGGMGDALMDGAGRGPASNAGAGGVIITNNYAAPPPDPHTWSQSLAWEVKTAVS